MLQVRHEFDEPDFAMIDTLFSLAEAHLFMQLVELQDKEPHLLPPGKTRPDLYRYRKDKEQQSNWKSHQGTLIGGLSCLQY